jgi:predicted phage terminase large subunit-like protein
LFGRSRLNPKKSTETEFETTQRGYRLATSVGGTLTGRGGDLLIVDDPIKANDANSEVALTGADEWFHNTALSRLDCADSIAIVTMQRLHQKDLSGILIEKGWPHLAMPAVATQTQIYAIGKNEIYTRPVGEILQPQRDTAETTEAIRRGFASRLWIWEAQYQQDPTPAEGNIIKAEWLHRYDFRPGQREFRHVVLACDPAGKNGVRNDYTAIVICGFDDKKEVYILHVARGHWTINQMRNRIKLLADQWNVNRLIIEDTASGMGLIQLLRDDGLNVMGSRPQGDKQSRLERHQALFADGRILLPKEASWSATFETELLAFPNAGNDDQVDALVLFLDWLPKAMRYTIPDAIGLPYVGPCGDYPEESKGEAVIGVWAGRP